MKNQLVHFTGSTLPFWGALTFIVCLANPINIVLAIVAIIAAIKLPKGHKALALYGAMLVFGLEMIATLIYILV